MVRAWRQITATVNVMIQNVAPTATLSAPAAVDEGSPFSVALINPFDPAHDNGTLLVNARSGGGKTFLVNVLLSRFLAHGMQDPVVPLQAGEMSRDALRGLGYDVEWHAYPMQHSVCMEEVRDLNAWLLKVLG